MNQQPPGVAVVLAAFPGACVVANPEPREGRYGRGEAGWQRWMLEAIDRQIAEYRAAGGADSLPPDPERYHMARADCPQAQVLVKRAGTRVVMFTRVNSRWRRVCPFASPYMTHSMRVAERWYGPPERGWTLTGRGGRQAHREAMTGATQEAIR